MSFNSSDTSTDNRSQQIRFGIIGCGWFGRVHVERLTEIPGVLISAVSDPDLETAQRLADKVPAALRPAEGVAVFTNYRDLLHQRGLHAVSINSPNRWHVEQLLAALEVGLHVLCEKPLTMVPDEVTQVVEAEKRAQRIVAIAYQSRYRRDSRLLRRALESGQWGRITSIHAYACENWVTPNVGTWRHDPTRCFGGYFGDANSHQLDVLFWLTGLEAKEGTVQATMERRGTPVPIVSWGEARLVPRNIETAKEGVTESNTEIEGGGIPFTFNFVGDARRWREEITIHTERADFVLRDTQLLWSDGTCPLAPFVPSEAGMAEAEDTITDTPDSAFVKALRGGTPVASPPETVWPVLRFTLAALKGNV